MLILSRKVGERIVVGDNVEIEIVEIRGNKVRIGIDAPSIVSIHRKEIWRENQEQPGDASEADGSARENLRRAV